MRTKMKVMVLYDVKRKVSFHSPCTHIISKSTNHFFLHSHIHTANAKGYDIRLGVMRLLNLPISTSIWQTFRRVQNMNTNGTAAAVAALHKFASNKIFYINNVWNFPNRRSNEMVWSLERERKMALSVRPSWIPFGKFYGEFYININTGNSNSSTTLNSALAMRNDNRSGNPLLTENPKCVWNCFKR